MQTTEKECSGHASNRLRTYNKLNQSVGPEFNLIIRSMNKDKSRHKIHITTEFMHKPQITLQLERRILEHQIKVGLIEYKTKSGETYNREFMKMIMKIMTMISTIKFVTYNTRKLFNY